MKRLFSFLLLTALVLPWPRAALAQTGKGPHCDFVFLRNAKRAGNVCVCYFRTDGAVQRICIPVFAGQTPGSMAADMTAAINGPGTGMSAVGSTGGMVCAFAKAGTVAIRRWTVTSRDGEGGLLKDVGPGPTDSTNTGLTPPTPSGHTYLPPKIQLRGTSNGTGTTKFIIKSNGTTANVNIPPGTPNTNAVQMVELQLAGMGWGVTDLGMEPDPFDGSLQPTFKVATSPGPVPIVKLNLINYDEDGPTSSLGINVEMEDLAPVPASSPLTLVLLAAVLAMLGMWVVARTARAQSA